MSSLPNHRRHSKPRKRDVYADPDRRPALLALNEDGVPDELKAERRWVVFRLEGRPDKRGGWRWDKVPYRPDGRRASSTDPATWTTFAKVVAAYRGGRFDGVGFVLGDGWAGIDLDDVRDPDTGDGTPDAKALVRRFATYAEASPSGTGVKLFGRGDWRGGWNRKRFPGGGEVEVYSVGRYFTVTGHPVTGDGVADIQAHLDELATGFPTGGDTADPPEGEPGAGAPDDELIARAKAAANGAKFDKLWAGDWSDYPSPSEAELALCSILAPLTGGDAARIDRLVRRSKMMRDKWDQRRGSGTYGQRTVAKAIAGMTESSTPAIADTPADEPGDPPGDGDAPVIRIGPDEHRANAQAVAALAAEPGLYQRGGMLVEVFEQGATTD